MNQLSQKIVRAKQILLCGILLAISLSPLNLLAQESDEAIWRAATNLQNNPHNQAIVLKNINRLHTLRGMAARNNGHLDGIGSFSNMQYQEAMFWHQSENLLIARKAVRGLGAYQLDMQRVAPDAGEWRIGSDTDFLIRRRDGKPVTLEDIQKVERAYRQTVGNEVRRRGGGAVRMSAGVFDTGTDFMVAHDATTPEEFSRIATYFQGKGADTYKRIEAARVEARYRSGQKIDVLDAGSYVTEMVEQAERKQRKLRELSRRMGKESEAQRKRTRAEIRQLEIERNKYIQRINKVNQRLASQTGAKLESTVYVPTVGESYDVTPLGTQATSDYIHTLGNILSRQPADTALARQTAFTLALQLYDMPLPKRAAYLNNLPEQVKGPVNKQFEQMQQWRKAEQERISENDVTRLRNFLKQTEFGQNLLKTFNSEISALTTRPTESSRFLTDVYNDLAATDRKVQNRAQSLAMWLNLAVQARDAKSDAELAILLGRTLASTTYYGTVAEAMYTGLVEGDGMALARTVILMLCPKSALPQVVESIGNSVINLTSGVLEDHQLMVLYASAEFTDGTFTGLGGYKDGSDAICKWFDEVLKPGGNYWVEGVFVRALELSKERNLGQDVLSGINAFSSRAFVKALESTVYGGRATFMGQHGGVQQARGAVAKLTERINEVADTLGRSVPANVGPGWEVLAEFDPAHRRAMKGLLEHRASAWADVQRALCAAVVDFLETRHRAEQGLEGGDEAALALLDEVVRLFTELDMFDLGMEWLEDECAYGPKIMYNTFEPNAVWYTRTPRSRIEFWLSYNDKEVRIKAMQGLQRFYDAYSTVHEIRGTVEDLYRRAGGEEALETRPLTGVPPLTADPGFDQQVAAKMLQSAVELFDTYEKRLWYIKRDALCDNQVQLDAPFDRRILLAIYAEIIGLENDIAMARGEFHDNRRRAMPVRAWRDMKQIWDHGFRNPNWERARAGWDALDELVEEFRAHYDAIQRAIAILPPAAVIEDRAVPGTPYAFGLEAAAIPPETEYVWREGDRIIGRGETLSHTFETAGQRTLRVEATWAKSTRVECNGSIKAEITVVIHDDAAGPSLAIQLPDDLGEEAERNRAYAFRSMRRNIPDDAEISWLVNYQPAGVGAEVQLHFSQSGPNIVELIAEWEVEGSWNGGERVMARPQTVLVEQGEPELAIIPPPDLLDGTGEPNVSYVFATHPRQIPDHATYAWRVDGEVRGRGEFQSLHFPEEGEYQVSVTASWTAPQEEGGHPEVLQATYAVRISLPPPEPEPEPEPEHEPEHGAEPETGAENQTGKKDQRPSDVPDQTGSSGGQGGPSASPAQREGAEPSSPVNVVPGETPSSAGETSGGEVKVGDVVDLDFSPPYRKRYPELFEMGKVGKEPDQPNSNKFYATADGKIVNISGTWSSEWRINMIYYKISLHIEQRGHKVKIRPETVVEDRGYPDRDMGHQEKRIAPKFNHATGRILETAEGLFLHLHGKDVPTDTDPIAINIGRAILWWSSNGRIFRPEDKGQFWRQNAAPPRRPDSVNGETEGILLFAFLSNPGSAEFEPKTSKEGLTRVTFKEPGRYEVWADVRITENGKTRTETSQVYVFNVLEGEPEITLAEMQREVVFGQSLGLSTTIIGTGKDLATRVVWHASPTGNTFANPFTEGRANTLTFGRMGTVRVFAELQAREGNAWVKVAESEVQEVDVVAPSFELVFSPQENAKIGENLRVKVLSQPKVPEELIEFRWLRPAKRHTHSSNASEIGFVIGEGVANPAAPIPLEAIAVAKGSGDRIAEIKGSYTPGTYELTVEEPRFRGPTPQVWDPERGGLVNAPRGSVVTHQQVSIGVSLDPAPPGEVRYAWSVSAEGGRTHGSTGRSQTFSAHAPGTYVIAVTARTPSGVELARGQRSVTVLDSRPEPPAEDGDQEDQEKRKRAERLVREGNALEQQGKLEVALAKYEAALRIYEIDGLAGRIQNLRDRLTNRARAQKLVNEGNILEQRHHLTAALAKYEAAQRLYEIDGVAARIQRLRDQLEKRTRAQKLIEEGYALEQQDDLAGAIEKYEAAQQIHANKEVAARIQRLRGQLEKRTRAQKLIEEGYALEQQDDLASAIEKYEEAQALYPDEGVAKRVQTLREKLANRTRAQKLIEEGYALEQQDDLAGAIEKYEEAQALYPDEEVAERIESLREKLVNRTRAQKLIEEGYALEQQDDLAGAIEKYEAAQQIHANKEVAARIQRLRGQLEKRTLAQKLIEEGYALEQRQNHSGAIGKYEEAQRLYANDGVAKRIAALRDQIAAARRSEQQAQLAAERQRRDAEARRAEQQRLARQRRQQAEREAEQKRQEQARREAEQRRQAQAAQKQSLTGTYVAVINEGGTRVKLELNLIQQGNQVTGTMKHLFEQYPEFNDTQRANGTVNGNRLNLRLESREGSVNVTLAVSSDYRTLTDEHAQFRRK